MKVVIIGEAWGRAEAQMLHPLVGASGRELACQIGISGLGPFLQLSCRKCQQTSDFTGPSHCPSCHEHRWPTELDLISYWKNLRETHSIAVTNVFNEQPPNQCAVCNSLNISGIHPRLHCLDCKSKDIKTNNIDYFFGLDQETSYPRYAMPKTRGGFLKKIHEHHLLRLSQELESWKPNIVIALGNTPCWFLLNQTKISALRGTVNWSKRFNLKVLPTYHPAGVLRSIENRPDAISDLTKAKFEADFPEIRRQERWILIPEPNEKGIEEIKSWFGTGLKRTAVDIEVLRGQISFISFSRDPHNSISIPFRDAKSYNGKLVDVGKVAQFLGFEPKINYWPTLDLELKAWQIARSIIEDRNIELIFQNGMFDISFFLKMKIFPYGAYHDTMIWHHARYPEKQKSLGYMASLYSREIPWKLMGKHQTFKRDE